MAVNSETLSSLITAVRDAINEAQAGHVSDSEIKRTLNEGLLLACSEIGRLEKEQTITLVASQAEYDLPDDHKDTIDDLQYQSSAINRKIKFIPPSKYRSDITTRTNDIPSHYCLINRQIVFYPTPSTSGETVSHRYVAYPQALVDPTDVPYNGIKRYYPYHLGLVNASISDMFLKQGDIDRASIYFEKFKRSVAVMAKDTASDVAGGAGQMARVVSKIGTAFRLMPPYIPERV